MFPTNLWSISGQLPPRTTFPQGPLPPEKPTPPPPRTIPPAQENYPLGQLPHTSEN